MDLKGADINLDGISKAADAVNFEGLNANVDQVQSKFSALEAFATGVFSKLGGQALESVERLGKETFLTPMIDGFSEYELQMKSVQTISANTGLEGEEGIAQINAALDELNEYADLTIYNFSEMTRNIGTFTAAGVDMDTATTSIKGIANMAAISGSTSQQASTAMYQLSQAIAAGSVKLQDWNSVVNAGMGGKVFQDALVRTAKAMAKTNGESEQYVEWLQSIEDGQTSFRESLQRGWVTADVLTNTLGQLTMATEDQAKAEEYRKQLAEEGFTEKEIDDILKLANAAQDAATKVRTWTQLWDTVKEALGSGWSQTWRTILGDFLEATELFTFLSDQISGVINASSDARNQVLNEWAEHGGRDHLFAAIKYFVFGLKALFGPIADAFSQAFGVGSTTLVKLSRAIRNLAFDFDMFAHKYGPVLGQVFSVIFNIIAAGLKVLTSVGSMIGSIIGKVASVVIPVLEGLIGLIGGLFYVLWQAVGGLNGLRSMISGAVVKVFNKLAEAASFVSYKIADFISSLHIGRKILHGFELIRDYFSDLSERGGKFTDLFSGISLIFEAMRLALSGLKEALPKVFDILKNPGTIVEKLKGIKDVFANINKELGFGVNGKFYSLFDWIKGSLSDAYRSLQTFGGKIIGKLGSLKDNAISTVTGVIDFFKNLTPQTLYSKIKDIISGLISMVRNVFPDLADFMLDGFNHINPFFKDVLGDSETFAEAFGKVFETLKTKIKELPESIQGLFDNIKRVFGYGADNISDEFGKLSLANIPSNLMAIAEGIAGAVGLIFFAVVNFGKAIVKGFETAVDAFITFVTECPIEKLQALAEVIKTIRFFFLMKSISKLADTFGKVGKSLIDWPKQIGDAFSNFGKGFNDWRKETDSDKMVKMAIAIGILAGSLFVIASLPTEDLIKAGVALGLLALGLVGMATVIGILSKMKLIDSGAMSGFGAAIEGLGIGVLALSAAAVILSLLNTEQLAHAAAVIVVLATAASIFALGVGSKAASFAVAGLSLVLLALGLAALIPVVKAFGEIDADQLRFGTEAIATLLLALGMFGALGGSGIGEMLKGVAAVGVGFLAFAAGLLVLQYALSKLLPIIPQLKENWVAIVLTLGGALAGFAIACLVLKSADPAGLGKGLLLAAAALAILGFSLALISKIVDPGKFAAVAAMLAVLVIAFSIGAMLNQQNPKAIENLGKSMVKFAIGLALIGGVLAILTAVTTDVKKSYAIVGALCLLFLAFAGLGALDSKTFVSLKDTATSIVIFAAAIGVLAIAMRIMQGMSWQELALGLGVAVAALIAFGVATYLLRDQKDELPVMATSFLIFAAAVGVLAIALALMGQAIQTYGSSIALGLVALAVSMVIFGAVAWVLANFGGDAQALGVGFLAFSVGVLALAIAFHALAGVKWAAISEGLIVCIGVFALFVAAVFITGLALQTVGSGFLMGAAAVLIFGLGLLAIAGAIYLFNGLLTGVIELSGPLSEFFGVLGDMIGGLAEGIGGLVSWGTDRLNDFKSFFTGQDYGAAAEEIPNSIGDAIGSGDTAIEQGITTAAQNVDTDAAGQIISDKMQESTESAMGDYSILDTLMGSMSGDGVDFIGKLKEAGFDPESLGILGTEGGELFGTNFDMSMLENIGGGDFSLDTLFGGSLSPEAISAYTGNIGGLFGSGINESLASIDVSDGGASLLNTYASSITSNEGVATEAMDGVANSVSEHGKVDMTEPANYSIGTYISAIAEGATQAGSSAASVASSAKSNLSVNTYPEGQSIITGIMEGMASKTAELYALADEIAQNIKRKTKVALNSNSPSKEMIPVGESVPEGLAVGMQRMQGYLGVVSEQTAKTASDAMENTIDGINYDISQAATESLMPKISPVLSMNDFSNDIDRLNDSFGFGQTMLSGDPLGIGSLQDLTYGTDFTNGLHSIDNSTYLLRQDVKALTEAISNMEPAIIMDARGMHINDGNRMSLIAEDVVNAFLRRGMM